MQVEVGAAARPPGRFGAALGLAGLLLLAPLAWAEELPLPSQAPQAVRVADPSPNPLAAWRSAGSLLERAKRTRLAALQVGIPSFDAPARALLLDASEGSRLERAGAAVAVTRGLPLAQAALALARLQDDHDVPGAAAAAARGLGALFQHREARLWLEATGILAARNALFFGSLAFLAGLAALYARAAVHDLGDRLGRSLPLFACAGILGVLVLLPALLGQGLAGIGLSLFALALCYGSPAERHAAWLAAALLILALEVGTLGAARALVALDPDPVASAFQRIESGAYSDGEHMRLEHAAASDALAARGLALEARRSGRLQEAADRYAKLLVSDEADATLANNAANVSLALGNVARAVELYERAAKLSDSPEVLYNLSYAYGQAIRPSKQDETLQRLQRLAPALAFDLLEIQEKLTGGFTLDLPLPVATLRARAEQARALDGVAFELRRSLAPGAVGAAPVATLAAFLVAAALARGAAGSFRRSGACRRCGGRLCPRCDGAASGSKLCAACQRLFERPETADPERRVRRLAELERRARWLSRARLAASVALPAAAGLLARRPWLGLAGALALAAVAACVAGLPAQLTDPLAAGGAGVLAFRLACVLCLGLYASLVALALRQRSAVVQ